MMGGSLNASGVEVDVHMIVVDVANSGIVSGTVSRVAGAPGKSVENNVSGVRDRCIVLEHSIEKLAERLLLRLSDAKVYVDGAAAGVHRLYARLAADVSINESTHLEDDVWKFVCENLHERNDEGLAAPALNQHPAPVSHRCLRS